MRFLTGMAPITVGSKSFCNLIISTILLNGTMPILTSLD
jgi:hypothetical protein